MTIFLCFLSLFFSSAIACDRCVHYPKAAYYYSPSAISVGACGYGSLALGFYNGYVAAGISSLYREGVGCGGCFQMRCKNSTLCSVGGSKVIMTDLNINNQMDFVLSAKAFVGMARKGMSRELKKQGIVDVEYKRVPCDYKNQNMSVWVEENSKNPSYLAIKFLNQGGQTDIVAVDVAQLGSSDWHYMSRNYGAVWDTSRVPVGKLQLRMLVTAGYDGKWIWAAKEVLDEDWEADSVYDSGVQIQEIAQESCSPCDKDNWE